MLDLVQPPGIYQQMIDDSYADRKDLELSNPMGFIPEVLTGRSIRFYAGPNKVPVDSLAIKGFRQRFGDVAKVSTEECDANTNSAVALCPSPIDLLKWFSRLERRVEP